MQDIEPRSEESADEVSGSLDHQASDVMFCFNVSPPKNYVFVNSLAPFPALVVWKAAGHFCLLCVATTAKRRWVEPFPRKFSSTSAFSQIFKCLLIYSKILSCWFWVRTYFALHRAKLEARKLSVGERNISLKVDLPLRRTRYESRLVRRIPMHWCKNWGCCCMCWPTEEDDKLNYWWTMCTQEN